MPKVDMTGHYSIVYSPDEKAYYAELWWNDEMSPLFATRSEAISWARTNGGIYCHNT